MKNMTLLITLLFVLYSCKDEESQPKPMLELAQDTLVYSQAAVTAAVQVKASADWTASVPQDAREWCTAERMDNILQIALTENTGDGLRKTDVTVTMDNLREKLHIKQLGQEPDIIVGKSRIDVYHRDTLIALNVASNVAYDIVIPDTVDWIVSAPQGRAMQEYEHSFRISENKSDEPRFTNITFRAQTGGLKREVMIRQDKRDTGYNPGAPGEIGDILIPVASGEASQEHPGEEIEKSFDGSTGSWYHSPWSGTQLPVTLEYRFESPQEVDYIVYKPRSSGDNGVFGKFDLYVSTSTDPGYTKVGTYDFKESLTATRITFDAPQQQAISFRFVVNSGRGGYVSCGEMEFYRKGAPITGLDEVFADALCSELRPGTTQKQVDGIENDFFRKIAQSLLDGTYQTTYRVQEYQPYRPIDDLAGEMKTSGYCPFENATGICFAAGEEVVVLVENTGGEPVQLKVYDFDAVRLGVGTSGPETYPLQEGINKLNIGSGGLVYIDYFTPAWETAAEVKIHIPSGKVNGYFDRNKHSAADWRGVLNDAVYGCIDIKGNNINLVYGVNSLKTYCTDGMKLIEKYDEITALEYEIMGLVKYNRVPRNHMFARVVKSGLFADGWGAGFAEDCMNELADIEKCTKQGVWAIAHELGHVNQIRPGLKWVSTTEVTNNIYSVCARYKYYRENLNLERERVNDGDDNHVLGGRFNSYLNYGIVKGEQWLCQRGQDKMTGYEDGGDHFVKLCPLWQLLLYYREILGRRDWYGDVAEIVRNTDESNMSNGELQLNFMRNTCDVLQEDLTDFFIKAGMLKPIDKELDDYSRGWLKITQQECDELVQYASRYPKPATPVLYYLTANSEQAYKGKLAVEGVYNEGVKVRGDGRVYVEHSVWKNVTVFETYQGDELIKVAMVGTDSSDLSNTLVRYPEGATRIEAVGWDGKRWLVYGER